MYNYHTARAQNEKILRSPFGDQLEKYSHKLQIFSHHFV